MEKINVLDRVSQGYYNELGEGLGKAIRQRVHWICNKTEGDNVLDVGCSQGIASIILAREGVKVLGIDIDQAAIEYANKAKENENKQTQNNVKFLCENFIEKDFGQQKYDTVIASEILEHLTSPTRFVKKIFNIMEDNGRLVVTVPFGINDFFDHKKTYYYYELAEELTPYFDVVEQRFFGKWIGIICRKNNSKKATYSIENELLKSIEDNFYSIERDYVDYIKRLEQSIEKTKTDNRNHEKELDTAKKELDAAKKELDAAKKELDAAKKRNVELENREKSTKNELKKCLVSEKKALKECDILQDKNKRIKMELNNINKEYTNLKCSKLGRIQTKYWARRKKK